MSEHSHWCSSLHCHLTENVSGYTIQIIEDLLAALKSQKTHRLLEMNSFTPIVGEFDKRSWKVTGLASVVPSAMPLTCTDTTWLPTTVLDTVVSCDVFLTRNSTGELYTVNAIDRALLSSWILLMISCGRDSAAVKLEESSSEVWVSFVDNSNPIKNKISSKLSWQTVTWWLLSY